MIVVDASVVVDFLLGRAATVSAIEGALDAAGHEVLHAPELVEPESLSAIRRLAAAGLVTDARATAAVADLGRLRLLRYGHAPLRDRVWELREELNPYDASYLALAEAMPESTLLTADSGLARRARRSLGDERVGHVT